MKGNKALLIVMPDSGCPISKSYAPRVTPLESRCGACGVAFPQVNVNGADAPNAIQQEVELFGLARQYVHDPKARIGKLPGVRSTGEVFVLDSCSHHCELRKTEVLAGPLVGR